MSTVSSPAQPPATRRSLDPSRLAQLDARLARFVDSGLLPGWQIAISQHGELTHFSSYGRRDVESDLPVADDTIFRLYSMTKPITAVAALRLWERGEFLLNEPVAKYLPAFAHQKVWRSGTSTKPELEPVTETMRIWHLFAHMSGLTYGFANAHPVDGLYRQAGLEWGVPAEHIQYEAFGPATVRGLDHGNYAPPCNVQFARSGRTLRWTGAESSLLELAEQNGVPLDSGCRAGNCGQCRVMIAAGQARYAKRPGVELMEGECLACIAWPHGDLIVDA